MTLLNRLRALAVTHPYVADLCLVAFLVGSYGLFWLVFLGDTLTDALVAGAVFAAGWLAIMGLVLRWQGSSVLPSRDPDTTS